VGPERAPQSSVRLRNDRKHEGRSGDESVDGRIRTTEIYVIARRGGRGENEETPRRSQSVEQKDHDKSHDR
jgi:hypothetical protein